MEDRSDSETESDNPKLMGEKRSGVELGEIAKSVRKRVKMRDLASVCCSEDLNTEEVSSAMNRQDIAKSRDFSECGSSTGPLEEKDPLRVWKEMKQNGYLSSSSHGGIPLPKQHGRKSKKDVEKSKNDVMANKMEIAKKEQVDRFAKMAAPSGLLKELNPGIITNVRNMKQVHSIIEGLLKSERLENRRVESKHASQMNSANKEMRDLKDQENVKDSIERLISHEAGSHNMQLGREQNSNYKSNKKGDTDSSMLDEKISDRTTVDLDSPPRNKDDVLALKVSLPTAKAVVHASSVSTLTISGVSLLSVKAATVASQWLELLYQDIKGRLAALQRSKKRVSAVIHTELPFLLAKEFTSNQENDPFVTQSSAGCSNKAIADMHQARWGMLFVRMYEALSHEEKELECWLNQLREMQMHCEKGLQYYHLNTQPLEMSSNSSGSEIELAVSAAAASIYATCNFLLSKGKVQS